MDTVESYSSAEAEIRLRAKYRTSTQEDADWLLVKLDGMRAEIGHLRREQCTHKPVPMPLIQGPGNPVPMPSYPGQIWCLSPSASGSISAEDIGKQVGWVTRNVAF